MHDPQTTYNKPSAGVKQYYVAASTDEGKIATLVELLQALTADQPVAACIACSSRDSLDTVVTALATACGFQLAVLHADLAAQELAWQVQQVKASLQAAGGTAEPTADAPGGEQLPSGVRPQQQYQVSQQQQQQQPPPEGPGDAAPGNPLAPPAAAAGGEGGGLLQRGWDVQEEQPPPPPPQSLPPLLITTDVCLQALSKDLLPLGLPLLIQYDVPASKEVYLRRVSSVFGASKQRRRGGRGVVVDFVVAGQLAAFRARERFSSQPIHEMPVHVPDIFAA